MAATSGMVTRESCHGVEVEWKIQNFLNLPHQTGMELYSPTFSLDDEHWNIEIFPKGNKFSEWISLFLNRIGGNGEYSVLYSFEMKAGGTVFRNTKEDAIFEECDNWGEEAFVKRSDLFKLLTSTSSDGALTVVCSICLLDHHLQHNASQTSRPEKGISQNSALSVPGEQKMTSESNNPKIAGIHTTVSSVITEDYIAKILQYYDDDKIKAVNAIARDLNNEAAAQPPTPNGLETLSKNFKELFLAGHFSDIKVIAQGQQFYAHRMVLASRSPVFAAMFHSEMAEKRRGVVNIPDMDAECAEAFLLFLYTGQFDIVTSNNAVRLYEAADKYDVPELKVECRRQMSTKLSIVSLLDVIELAVIYDEHEILEKATKYFIENAEDVISTENWELFYAENTWIANKLLIKMVKSLKSALLAVQGFI